MILTQTENLSLYAALSPHFETAIRFVMQTDLSALPDGKTFLDGENVYVNVKSGIPDNESGVWEAHARYADIQILLSGKEKIGCGWRGKLNALDPEKDLYLGFEADGFSVTLSSGQAVIFLPGEPHAPDMPPEGANGIRRKAVIKVLMP